MSKKTVVNTVESDQIKSKKGSKTAPVLAEIRAMTVLNIIDKIHAIIQNIDESGPQILWVNTDVKSGRSPELVIKGDLHKYVQVLAERFCLTNEQALFLSYFVKNCDDGYIRYCDISSYYNNIGTSRILEHAHTLQFLVESGYIQTSRNYDNELTFSMTNDVVLCIIQGKWLI